MAEFFYMGGYAFHVWSSYALAFVILFINIVGPSLRHKKNLRSASDFQQQNEVKADDA